MAKARAPDGTLQAAQLAESGFFPLPQAGSRWIYERNSVESPWGRQ